MYYVVQLDPFFLDDAECELNCKPVGLSYFATLNDRVIDGTSCFKPSEYLKLRRNHAGKAICVDGICKVSLNAHPYCYDFVMS